MVTVNLICVGGLKEQYLRDACAEYSKRLSRFCKLNILELNEQTMDKEAQDILPRCSGFVTALCIEGELLSSEQLAALMEKQTLSHSSFTFIIGGSEGLARTVKERADYQLSFSKMTFPHQLMRVILLEQIYRAFTINSNITYHK